MNNKDITQTDESELETVQVSHKFMERMTEHMMVAQVYLNKREKGEPMFADDMQMSVALIDFLDTVVKYFGSQIEPKLAEEILTKILGQIEPKLSEAKCQTCDETDCKKNPDYDPTSTVSVDSVSPSKDHIVH